MVTKEKIIEILHSHSYNVEDQAGNHLIVVDDDSWGEIAEQVKNCSIPDVSERVSSEGEILQWMYLNMPFAIKPKSKNAKTLLVSPFTSNHAFEEVCKHLANKLYNAR